MIFVCDFCSAQVKIDVKEYAKHQMVRHEQQAATSRLARQVQQQ